MIQMLKAPTVTKQTSMHELLLFKRLRQIDDVLLMSAQGVFTVHDLQLVMVSIPKFIIKFPISHA